MLPSTRRLILALGLAGSLAASATGYVLHQRSLMEQPRYLGQTASVEEDEEEGGMRPDKPQEWARFRRLQQSDEKGLVNPNGAVNAMAARKALVRRGNLPGLGGGGGTPGLSPPSAAGIDRATWTSIGPGNIGGRVRTISIDPTDGSKILVGSAGGGIWSTTNGGESWAPVAEFLGSIAVSSIARSPARPEVVYAGTGEPFFTCSSLPGAGIFKSSNGGVTWGRLASTDPETNPDWAAVTRIAVHPTNPNILLAATGELTAGVRCDNIRRSSGGLYRSTDAGASWTKVFSTGGVVDAKFQPDNGNTVIISVTRNFSNFSIFYSNDEGVSWQVSNLDSTIPGGRKEIAFSGGTAYISSDICANFQCGEVWSSVNGGATWIRKSSPGHLSQGYYANAIWADPTDARHVIVGGLDLFESLDAGESWRQISSWGDAPNSAHADHHAIVSSPTYGISDRTIYFGNDGGVYKTRDIRAVTTPTTGWTSLNNGLSVTQFYDGAGGMVGGTVPLIVGGTQDNGSLVYKNNGTTDWQQYYSGDGGFAAVDVSNPDITHVYGEYIYLALHRADRLDKALTGGSYTVGDIYSGIDDDALFISPFALDPNNPSVMYAGGRKLWRSTNVTDQIPSWSPVAEGDTLISQIAIAEGASRNVWFGTTSGSVYASTTATPVFNNRSDGLPQRMVLALLVDKSTPSTVYASFGGYSASNLYRTTDGGAHWTSIHGNLPAGPIYTIQRHPTNPGYLYVGTEVGVFASEDGGATWSTTNDGPANVPVMKLFWLNNSTLVASTHGRGMYTANVTASGGTLLSVLRSGSGGGTVMSQPSGINCGVVCSATFVTGSSVTLSATPDRVSTFGGWSGACTGMGTCTITLDAAASVTAIFNRLATTYALTISRNGTGAGTVESSPDGLECLNTCTTRHLPGSSVTLSATPTAGSVFKNWSGACSGTGTCTVIMSAARDVTATFASSKAETATALQNGVMLSGIAGETDAQKYFSIDVPRGASNLVITTSPGVDSTGDVDLFVAYEKIPTRPVNDCTSNGPDNSERCATAAPGVGAHYILLTSNGSYANVNLVASYTVGNARWSLAISKNGTGAGTVTSTPTGIDCGATCSATFASGSLVTLTATPVAGSTFAGWSGDCTGSATCTITMDTEHAATASFALIPTRVLSVNLAGTGSGTVSSLPQGISCGSACTASYAEGTMVTLSATAASGSSFAGWSGACGGTAACTVTMAEAKSVTATFTLVPQFFALTIGKAGTGAGTVTSSPAGINCGVACSASFEASTTVVLTATPAPGSTFTAWSGQCAGSTAPSCTVAMTQARSATATFTLAPRTFALTIVKAGSGSGSVTGPAAVSGCQQTCAPAFAPGTKVTLKAVAAVNSAFSGWSGACSGSGACTVVMNAAKQVTATFKATAFTLSIRLVGTGTGMVTSKAAGISCGGSCTKAYKPASRITLSAVPARGSTFTGWGGACAGVKTCVLGMTEAREVTAQFSRR